MNDNQKPDENPHEYRAPMWLKVETNIAIVVICIAALYIGVTYGTDFYSALFYSLATGCVGILMHYIIVERPVRIQWIIEHMLEYHADDNTVD